MSERLTLDRVHAAIVDGVSVANSLFLTMSGGSSVRDYGVEPLISAQIAMSLWKIANARDKIPLNESLDTDYNVTLESSFYEIAEWAGSERRGKKTQNFTDNQKADVVLWSRRNAPIGVVEVKRHFVFSNLSSDLDRIDHIISRHGARYGGSMRWGAVAGMRELLQGRRKEPEQIAEEACQACRDAKPHLNFRVLLHKELTPEPVEYGDDIFDGFASFAILATPKRA